MSGDTQKVDRTTEPIITYHFLQLPYVQNWIVIDKYVHSHKWRTSGMRINEYMPVKGKNVESDNEDKYEITVTQGQKAALQSIKAKAKQNGVLSKDALFVLQRRTYKIYVQSLVVCILRKVKEWCRRPDSNRHFVTKTGF
jgi:hypothetical protein